MKRVSLPLAALCGITFLIGSARAQDNQPTHTDNQPTHTVASVTQADTPSKTGKSSESDKALDALAGDSAAFEAENLKRRVEELERQNRALAQTLAEINAKLNASAPSQQTASVTPAPASSSSNGAAAKPSTAAARADDTVRWSEILGEGNRIKLYGFLRLDLDFDSQRPNNGQIPFFIGYARAVGIPARFAIGFPLPAVRGAGQVSGYHCWAEFYVKGMSWVPVDASEAAKDPSKREYFFGAHDENRVEFTRGRDLVLNPKQQAEPLNYFVYPYAEVDGKPFASVEKSFSYRDQTATPVSGRD